VEANCQPSLRRPMAVTCHVEASPMPSACSSKSLHSRALICSCAPRSKVWKNSQCLFDRMHLSNLGSRETISFPLYQAIARPYLCEVCWFVMLVDLAWSRAACPCARALAVLERAYEPENVHVPWQTYGAVEHLWRM
jgi:hypothetical protein